ncbi:DUF262 domain-containing protein [Oscillatoria sp. FACHB-1406]|uniref:DUF262 domain-containing protein n=1 Tax=Oscillatoria sp. FACHB-1406 TaxID=2692846 RepID=UPI0016867F58|nr:DUF262 domain-containing protein [Oscillatoria sp. FACHB-1406]MBD2577151.1 DUF262 domain-containing protein [Oscillatoria sp. FACHB-1406]
MTGSAKSRLHLQAETLTVEGLIRQVKRGLIRVPDFQRPLRWESEDVKLFFDSIYQGYPVGSFLMRRAYAPASVIKYGPVKVDAPESNSALWVVDGQQRLTALTAGLARNEEMPTTPDDAWVLYFDAKEQKFQVPPKSGVFPSTWIPVTQLLDASALSEWVFNWDRGKDLNLRKSVFEAGTRIRQYEIPLYVVETGDEELLRDIFYRINDSGKKMKWEDIHDALFGRKSDEPSTLSGLADELKALGIGRPSEDQLLSAIIAFKGLDATRSISEHYRRDTEILRDAVSDALPALRQVLIFLKTHAEIPHLRLLPRSLPFFVLTRFFGLYPEPNSRTINLLVRWTWRTLLEIKSVDERTLLRHSLDAIKEGNKPERTMQKLLNELPRTKRVSFTLPQKFDARAADSRIVLVALSSLHPLNPENGKLIDIANLIEEYDLNAFQKIISFATETTHSPSNRILLPPISGGVRKQLVELMRKKELDLKILKSHCIDREAANLLINDKFEQFLSRRSKILTDTVDFFSSRLAAWGENDRPSISYILQQTGEEE